MYKTVNLLVVDDDESLVKVFERVAKEQGLSVATVRNGADALEYLNKQVVEVAIVDINLPGYNGMQVLEYVKRNQFPTEVIMMTGVGSVETAVNAIKMGAYDYITKPFDDINKVIVVINKALERYQLVQKIKRLERQSTGQVSYEELVGKSRRMQEVFTTIDSIAGTTSTILVLGESGTGKELVAKAVHKRSKRREKPFVVINCAALSEHLLESELFGHKKGSFTGAINDKKGLFEEADGGTIFLDEIGEIPPLIQVKLLRVLQEGEIRAVGGNQSKNVDVRVIAATNRDLQQNVKDGLFREDLFYRLNVISITLPPLRDRPEDIPVLAYHFLEKYRKKMDKPVSKISVDALQVLQSYKWVGNVRELENVVERAVVLVVGDTISARDLPPKLLGDSFYVAGDEGGEQSDLCQFDYQEAKNRALWSFNRNYLTNLLRMANGNLSNAASKAGMDRSNFKKIIKKYNVEILEFKKKGSSRQAGE